MIKVIFKEPQLIGNKQGDAIALFCLCTSYVTLSNGYFFYEFGEIIGMVIKNQVQSIEHVKPTDL